MLIARAGITDFETTKGHLIAGLSDYITDKLKWQPSLPDADQGITKWYELVQGFDSTNRHISAVKGGHSTGTYNARAKALPPGEPMEIDAMHLAKDDRDKRMREGHCFECNEQGHLARDCPKKRGRGLQMQKRSGPGGSKLSQICSLIKDLNADERRQVLEEMRVSPAVRIRAMIQELPEDEKEELVEQTVSEDFQ